MPDEPDFPEQLREEIGNTLRVIEAAAAEHEKEARQLRRWNSLFNFSSVTLGIAAPTLVAYFTQAGETFQGFGLVAILLVAFATGSGILSNTFRWGERFGHTQLAVVSLKELASSTRLRALDLERTTRPEALPEVLSRLTSQAMGELHDITRSVVEREVAVVRQQRERVENGVRAAEEARLSAGQGEAATVARGDLTESRFTTK